MPRARPGDRDFGLQAVFLQGGEQAGVASVKIVADLQMAGFVNKCRLIGNVHRDLVGEAQVDLGVERRADG